MLGQPQKDESNKLDRRGAELALPFPLPLPLLLAAAFSRSAAASAPEGAPRAVSSS